MSSEELKPCPFCGSAKIEADFGDESAKYRCRDCGAQSGRVWFTAAERESDNFSASEAEALAAWNRRDTSTGAAALEEAAQVCEGMHDEDRPSDYAYAIRALITKEPT